MSQRTFVRVEMTADIHDLAYFGDGYALFPDDAGRSLTGLTTPPTDYEEILFMVGGLDAVTLVHDSASSGAGNRFYLKDPSVPGDAFIGADRILYPGVPYWLVYDKNGVMGAGWYGEGTGA